MCVPGDIVMRRAKPDLPRAGVGDWDVWNFIFGCRVPSSYSSIHAGRVISIYRHRGTLYSADERGDGNREADKLHHCGLKLVIRLRVVSGRRWMDAKVDGCEARVRV